MSESYIYTFVRDILPHTQKIVQIGHACYEAGKKFTDSCGISNLILLSARNEEDLLKIADNLEVSDINHTIFYEPDNEMGHSAICTEPITKSEQRALFRKYKLVKFG